MSVFPTIDRWERHSELSRKLLLCQPQDLPKFSNQLTNGWLVNIEVILVKRHQLKIYKVLYFYYFWLVLLKRQQPEDINCF